MKKFVFIVAILLLVFSFITNSNANNQRIQFKGPVSLKYILGDIASQTGIKFFIPENLENHTIFAHVDADNWKTAIHQLLGDLSQMELWGDELSSSKVWVFGEGSQELNIASVNKPIKVSRRPTPTPQTVSSQKVVFAPQVVPALATQNAGSLAQPASYASNAFKVAPVEDSPINRLPPHVKHDPEVLRFLNDHNVEMPQSVKNKYGERLENLPAERPLFPHVRKNRAFVKLLKSLGIRPPIG
jgi:hypothetical protein